MAERPNARLLKSLGMRVPGGSNPSPSAGQKAFLGPRTGNVTSTSSADLLSPTELFDRHQIGEKSLEGFDDEGILGPFDFVALR